MTAGSIPAALTGACGRVRPAEPADSVAGVTPAFVAVPAGLAECGAVLKAAAAADLAVTVRGTGTRLAWGNPPGRCDLVIDTTAMDRVLEHPAGDFVVRVQAGVRLGRLASALNAAGQRLALDPPAGNGVGGTVGGTVGGVLATGVAGPLRLRYGTPRDLLIGITLVRADGTVARAGGKVVKNVAGYDLGKLLAGSYGTLGLIAEATFRLHPLPGAAAYVTLDCPDAEAAAAVLRAAAGSPLAPVAAEIDRPRRGAPVRAGILLEGTPDGVAERAERMRCMLGKVDGTDRPGGPGGPGGADVSATPPPWWGRGAAAAADGTVARIAFWPGDLPGVLGAVDAAAAAAGLDPAVGGSAAAGVLHAAIEAEVAAGDVARFVTALRESMPDGRRGGPPARGSVVVLHAPGAVRDAVDLWGPVSSARLMRAVKEQFDPGHLMAPGRFAGEI